MSDIAIASGVRTDCQHCEINFEVIVEYVERLVDGKKTGEVTRFTCPGCGHVWNSAFTTRRGIEYRVKLDATRKLAAGLDVVPQRMQDEITRLARLVLHETKPLGVTHR